MLHIIIIFCIIFELIQPGQIGTKVSIYKYRYRPIFKPVAVLVGIPEDNLVKAKADVDNSDIIILSRW